jgi:hypothetical protein
MSGKGQKMFNNGHGSPSQKIPFYRMTGKPTSGLGWHISCIPYTVGYPVLRSKQ